MTYGGFAFGGAGYGQALLDEQQVEPVAQVKGYAVARSSSGDAVSSDAPAFYAESEDE